MAKSQRRMGLAPASLPKICSWFVIRQGNAGHDGGYFKTGMVLGLCSATLAGAKSRVR